MGAHLDVLLDVRNLKVEYSSNKQSIYAVNGVSFSLSCGETLGLVGETGAGKTSIAKAIMRILPDISARITEGSILFEGENILEKSRGDLQIIRGEKISMVFQDPMTALNPVKNIGSQITDVIALHNRHLSRTEAWKQAGKMLLTVGITEDRMQEFPHQFSGGMRQRVLIAMALACNPSLILADEPTTALDVTIQAQVLEMIQKLKKERNMAMLLITHDLGIVAENCDKVAVIYAGKIVEYGTVYEVFSNPSHPYTLGLFRAIPDLTSDSEWLIPIEGLPPDPTVLPQGCAFSARCRYSTEECNINKPVSENLEGEHSCCCWHHDLVRREGSNEHNS